MSGRRVANSQTDTPLGGLGVNASVSIEQALRVTNVCRSFQHVCLYLATRCRSECSSVRVLHCDRFRVHFCEIKVVSYADDVDDVDDQGSLREGVTIASSFHKKTGCVVNFGKCADIWQCDWAAAPEPSLFNAQWTAWFAKYIVGVPSSTTGAAIKYRVKWPRGWRINRRVGGVPYPKPNITLRNLFHGIRNLT